jgi:hypothetical protein
MISPPISSTGPLSDLRHFLLHRPEIPTLTRFESESDRVAYSRLIAQRVSIDLSRYAVLNVHRIGIDAPVQFVFGELLKWDGDSTCWPNHVAQVERLDDQLQRIDIFLFGRRRYPFGLERGPFGFGFIPLFRLKASKIKAFPSPTDQDSARFLHYECSGGYPIGHFIMFARSPIPSMGETTPTQLFLAVGFNFYGRERRSRYWLAKRLWEAVHNRVTANIMNRFKQLCEWKFQRLQAGR